MAEKVLMLALSPTMETGAIANWLKAEGDTVSVGDVLCEVETDKATMEYESVQEGTLLKIVVPEGGAAAVEETIAIIGEAGEDVSGVMAEVKSEKSSTPALPAGGTEVAGVSEPGESPIASLETNPVDSPDVGAIDDARVKASPLARNLAKKAGLALTSIPGTGPEGRVVKRDVETTIAGGAQAAAAPAPKTGTSAIAAQSATLADQVFPVSMKRGVIAKRLAESKYSAPHFYLKTAVFTEIMMDGRSALNSGLDYKVSVNAFLMKFCAEAIKRHPYVNSSWQGDTIHQFGSIDIGLAVAQDDGLITPIVRDCGTKGVIGIDRELADLISRARTNKLAPEEYTGATFSISSLGTFGIEEFTAIINPPGSAILAVGQMQKTPVVDENDQIVVRNQMKLTLSCDHRVIDGAKGAGFLTDLKAIIEHPIRALY